MVKKVRKTTSSEFPILDNLNLYASATTGDGNCLFRALSDQIYGDESRHSEIRHKVVEYVKDHRDHFEAFVGEFGENFDQYTSRLDQDGVFGGHIELVGFANVYCKQIFIYQHDNVYVIHPQDMDSSKSNGLVHIAYHSWEHYSSVRQCGSPSKGPVDIPMPLAIEFSTVIGDKPNYNSSSEIPQWKIDIVSKSVPDASDKKIREMLRTKDYETVIEELIMSDHKIGENIGGEIENEPTQVKDFETPEVSGEIQNETPGKATKNRKITAKQRRNEKKDRVRAKKQKQKVARTAEMQSEATTKVDQKVIIHI